MIDVQLAHAKKDKIQAAYDRAQFWDERQRMMHAWAEHLHEAENQKLQTR